MVKTKNIDKIDNFLCGCVCQLLKSNSMVKTKNIDKIDNFLCQDCLLKGMFPLF